MNCLFCNEAIHPKDLACPTCGYPVQEEVTLMPDAGGAPRQLDPRWVRAGAAAIGLAALCLLGGVVIGRLSAPAESAEANQQVASSRYAGTQMPGSYPAPSLSAAAPAAPAVGSGTTALPGAPVSTAALPGAPAPIPAAPVTQTPPAPRPVAPSSTISRVLDDLDREVGLARPIPFDTDGDGWVDDPDADKLVPLTQSVPDPTPPSHLLVMNPWTYRGGGSVRSMASFPGMEISLEIRP